MMSFMKIYRFNNKANLNVLLYFIQRVDIVNAKLEETLLLLTLEIINLGCPNLNHLDISYNPAGMHLINLLKICVETHDLKELILAGMGITSKMICLLSIGIANNNTLEELDLRENFISLIY